MKTTNAYKTSDGRLFEIESDALEWQAELDFRDWYDSNELYSGESSVKCSDIISWLKENKEMVLKIIGE